jgi:hypothetical protein
MSSDTIICMIKYRRTGWAVAGFPSVEDAIGHLGAMCWWTDNRTLDKVCDTVVAIKLKQEQRQCQEAIKGHILKRLTKRMISALPTKVLDTQRRLATLVHTKRFMTLGI